MLLNLLKMLPLFIRVRSDAWTLGWLIASSILDHPEDWTFFRNLDDPFAMVGSKLADVRIEIKPRLLRVCDELHLYINQAEVFLPLIPRLRLRNACRWYTIEEGRKTWNGELVDG